MAKKYTVEDINIDNLTVDSNNPRFSELYKNKNATEKEIINYLWKNEGAEKIAERINEKGDFYSDEHLWIITNPEKKGTYLVKDGNRRCAAVKVLSNPKEYGLNNLKKYKIDRLPTLLYYDNEELEQRIIEKHTSLEEFESWERLPQAIETYRIYKRGDNSRLIKVDLLKIAHFYKEAIEALDKLKKPSNRLTELLLQKSKEKGNKAGSKLALFERLFKYSELFGYKLFKHKIEVLNQGTFENYIEYITEYLQTHPSTTYKEVDYVKSDFMNKLKKKFNIDEWITNNGKKKASKSADSSKSNAKKTNIEKKSNEKNQNNKDKKFIPIEIQIKRKDVPENVRNIVKEYCRLNPGYPNAKLGFPNAKIAFGRVMLECVLKYVVDETKYDGKNTLSKTNYFKDVYGRKKGHTEKEVKFQDLRDQFYKLIKEGVMKKIYKDYNLKLANLSMHSYKYNVSIEDAKSEEGNLQLLIAFLLEEEQELIESLDDNQIKNLKLHKQKT